MLNTSLHCPQCCSPLAPLTDRNAFGCRYCRNIYDARGLMPQSFLELGYDIDRTQPGEAFLIRDALRLEPFQAELLLLLHIFISRCVKDEPTPLPPLLRAFLFAFLDVRLGQPTALSTESTAFEYVQNRYKSLLRRGADSLKFLRVFDRLAAEQT